MGTPRMPRFDVTIAGELNLDLILYGLPDELPPERELLADRMMLTLGGSSSIVAHNLAALGSRVGFQSRIGDDQLGQIALERLEQAGVDVSRVRHVAGATKTGFTLLGRSRFGLSRGFATLSFVVVLSAACLAATSCRVASEDESIRTHRFSRHE